MAIVRINLLPHREQKRQARQRQFASLTILSVLAGLAAVGIGYGILASRIDNQQSRNALLKTEIAKLDEQIKEIDRLREQIQAVLSRKQVVETLQANRSEAVHLLDQLVRQLPDGVYLRAIKKPGISPLTGYAQSKRACPRSCGTSNRRRGWGSRSWSRSSSFPTRAGPSAPKSRSSC
jgi:type IV pilus assembly protein PilN